jgi:hypothetical protein
MSNTESAWDEEFSWKPNNLSQKIFLEQACSDCLYENESKPMSITDNMGREIFWEDLGRPTGP